jgi:hypothetical protein
MQLRKVYSAGVANSVEAAGTTGVLVNLEIYRENAKDFRDNHGVASER